MQIFSIYSNFLLIFEVFSADLSFFSNPIINLAYLCIFRGPTKTHLWLYLLAKLKIFKILPKPKSQLDKSQTRQIPNPNSKSQTHPKSQSHPKSQTCSKFQTYLKFQTQIPNSKPVSNPK